MASPQYLEDAVRLKRPSTNVQNPSQLDRRRQDRADNVFTQIEDVTYAVLRRHTKSA